MKRFMLILLTMLLSISLSAKGLEEKRSSPFVDRLVPDYYRLQFAGGVGILSAGFGYKYWDNKIKVEYFYGYLPPQEGYSEVHTVGVKGSYLFYNIPMNAVFDSFSPIFSTSINFTVADANKTFFKVPHYMPDGYYSPNFVRFAPALGLNFTKHFKSYTVVKKMDFYVECVTNNIYLAYLIDNRVINPLDAFSIDFGFRISF